MSECSPSAPRCSTSGPGRIGPLPSETVVSEFSGEGVLESKQTSWECWASSGVAYEPGPTLRFSSEDPKCCKRWRLRRHPPKRLVDYQGETGQEISQHMWLVFNDLMFMDSSSNYTRLISRKMRISFESRLSLLFRLQHQQQSTMAIQTYSNTCIITSRFPACTHLCVMYMRMRLIRQWSK